jgi:hypothetical protein
MKKGITAVLKCYTKLKGEGGVKEDWKVIKLHAHTCYAAKCFRIS